jgi:diguanylate cyclase (GGDEF)-like protein
MTDRAQVARNKIARLRASFIAQLPQRLAQARDLHAALFAPEAAGRPEAAAELHRLLHSLKGTGGSLGLRALAEEAARGETLAVQLAEDLALATASNGRELLRTLEALEQQTCALIENPADTGTAEGELTPAFELSARPLAGAGGKTAGSKARLIYLCDDDPVQVKHLAAQLQCFGYRTASFTEPAALRAAILRQPPHAMIMDIIFPAGESAGTDTVADLNRELAERVPTVFISARNDFDARLRAVRAGGAAYFPKPVDVMALVGRLDALTIRTEPEPYRILVVDDEPEIAAYHAQILEAAGMITRILGHHPGILTELEDFHPDLVLMDMYMPQCNGRELAGLIRQIPAWVSLPIIFLSSETNRAKQFSALQVGAEGFLTKPVQPDELVMAVAIRSERMRDLRGLMVRDSLTGLFNHTTTTQMFATMLASANRQNKALGFAMIDVDHFKSVNDTYGHIMGDQVLVALARILRERLRGSDIIGRYGGEEFAVILRDVTLEEAIQIIDNVREDFSRVCFRHNGIDFHCAFSAGISLSSREKSMVFIRAEADRALYRAKGSGRNRVASLDG